MKAATARVVSMSGLRAAQAVAAAWIILALGGAGVQAQGSAPPGLVSWWQAEGNALDAQSANPGALVGSVAFVPGRVGQAFRLDGNSYVEVLSSETLEPATVTVAAWVRGVAPGPLRYIVSKGALDCVVASYALYTGLNGELYFYIGNGISAFLSASAGTAVWDGQWHFVAGTFDACNFDTPATVHLYVDGIEVGTGQPTKRRVAAGGLPERVFTHSSADQSRRPHDRDPRRHRHLHRVQPRQVTGREVTSLELRLHRLPEPAEPALGEEETR